jgi:hypothetical protein
MPGGMPGANNFGSYGAFEPDDPEMRELVEQDTVLDRQTHEMAAKLREVRGDERERMKRQIAEMVGKHFEIRQKRRELQLKRMDEEIHRLREAIAKRNDARQTIVETRVRELTGEPRDLDF